MGKIEKKLELWEKEGLISGGQRLDILKYEEGTKKKNVAVYAIITLGAIIVSFGIISIIAYNWEKIPGIVKLVIDFLILLLIGYQSYKYYIRDNNKAFGVYNTVYYLLVLASIGLISQVYHSGGKFYQATAFWAVITLPHLVFFSNRFTGHLWTAFFIVSVYGFLFSNFRDDDIVMVAYPVITALFGAAGTGLLSISAENIKRLGGIFSTWSFLGFLSGTIYLSVIKNIKTDSFAENFHFLLIFAVLAGFLLVYFLGKTGKKNAVLAAAGLILFNVMAASHVYSFNSRILDAVLFILIWFILAFVFHLLEHRRTFEFLIAGIGIRFLVVYFQVFGDLAVTGFGLIFSGLIIIGACLLYIKYRDRLVVLMDRLL